ncbi:MAG: glycosyltransferase family 2 protein, partial [Lactococcus sp.]
DKLSVSNKALIQDYVDLLNMPKEKRRLTLNQYNLRKNKSYHTKIFRTLILTKFAYKGKK